jgi:asparagine N-glycosylation enzyme membrane subunit Stt3
MEPVRQAQKKYAYQAMMAAIIIGLVFIIAGQKPMGKGLILGTIFSVINFILIGETLPLRLGKSRAKTFFFSLSSMLFRYVLLAIPLMVAIKFEQFNLFAAIFGIFMIQALILGDHLLKLIWTNR